GGDVALRLANRPAILENRTAGRDRAQRQLMSAGYSFQHAKGVQTRPPRVAEGDGFARLERSQSNRDVLAGVDAMDGPACGDGMRIHGGIQSSFKAAPHSLVQLWTGFLSPFEAPGAASPVIRGPRSSEPCVRGSHARV